MILEKITVIHTFLQPMHSKCLDISKHLDQIDVTF